jgi:cell division protease FtsH
MSEERSRLSPDFAASFKAFLDEVTAQAPQHPSFFVERLRALLGVEPIALPVVGQAFETPDQPNLQRALDGYLASDGRTHELLGVAVDPYGRSSMADLAAHRGDQALQPAPVEHASVTLADEVLPCVQNGLYLVQGPGGPLAAFVRGPNDHTFRQKVSIEAMAPSREAAEAFLSDLRRRMREGNVYRGRVLSLFVQDHALRIAFLPTSPVDRASIILPEGLLERVERQTLRFSAHAERLRALKRHLKRGVLLYGSPGTGKTLVTRYVLGAMPGRTSLVLTGRAMGLISQACALARTLQPATVVLEDVDLVAEERTRQEPGCTGVLFELLNEMDGLEDDADILFVLTTNRPDVLEPALASRPGRVDQAIEIPPPDAACRRRLFELYGAGMPLPAESIERFVKRTEGVSAAFIRELMRRAALFAADEGHDVAVADVHVDQALHDLVVQGGALTASLLGGRPTAPA